MDKKFIVVWGRGYLHQDDAGATVENQCLNLEAPVDDFCITAGYSQADVDAIRELEVGACYQMNEGGCMHSVVRVA